MGAGCSTTNTDVNSMRNEPSVHSIAKRVKSSIFSSSTSSDSESDMSGDSISYKNNGDQPNNYSRGQSSPSSAHPDSLPNSPIRRPTPTDPKITGLAEIPPCFRKMIFGRNTDFHMPEKVIYIYHCSGFTDSKLERDVLMENVYPAMRDYCMERGCALHVFDPSWNLKDEFAYGHHLWKLSRWWLQQCLQRKSQCIFTIFLNEKYGVYWCPLEIDVECFSGLLKKITEDDKHFLLKWYHLDVSLQTPCYVLQSVGKHIPRYTVSNKDTYKEGFRDWEKQLIRLRNVLFQAASPDFQRKYFMSEQEKELSEFVFSLQWPTENILWVRRNFTKMDLDFNNTILSDYLDVTGDHLSEYASAKLKNLVNRVNDRIDSHNKISLNVEWRPQGLDLNEKPHSAYVTKLRQKYSDTLKQTLNRLLHRTEEFDRCKIKLNHRGISPTLYTDLMGNADRRQHLNREFVGRGDIIETLEKYITQGCIDTEAKSPHPLVLHGERGSGKTSITAALADTSCTLEGWTSAVCITRFIGATLDFETQEQLLQSLTEHLCLLCQQETHPLQARRERFLSQILEKIPSSQAVIILLDGFDKLRPWDPVRLDWLPIRLPTNVRLLLTVNSDSSYYDALRRHLPENDYYLELPALTKQDVSVIIHKQCQSFSHAITTKLENEISENVKESVRPLHLKLITHMAHHFKINDCQEKLKVEPTVEEQMMTFLEWMERKYNSKVISRALTYISCTRYGISDSEINDLLLDDNTVMEYIFSNHVPVVRKIPPFMWEAIKRELEPCLLKRSSNALPVYTWSHQIFEDIIKVKYALNANSAQNAILRYFENLPLCPGSHSASTSSAPENKTTSAVLPNRNLSRGPFNRRKLDELPFSLYQQQLSSRLKKQCLFDYNFFSSKIYSCGLVQFFLDISFGENLDPGKRDMSFLAHTLAEYAHIVTEDPQIFFCYLNSKIRLGSSSINTKLTLFMKMNTSFSDHTNLPQLDLFGDLSDSQSEHTKPKAILTGLFNVKNDKDHVISVSRETGQLIVWRIRTQSRIRTLKGLPQPKDVKMSDSLTGVVLCHRELRIYNFDTGKQISVLKGVLNIFMPFYGIHSKNKTIALARNRMYLNMMDNKTGDMVSTFKVGEDRFLDSLLVSDNGNICVCGDAVQKPFPLLVWDLHSQKLIYDLRLQGHEFVTKIAAITTDGNYVVSVCKELEDPDPNFLIVYDLQSGSVYKRWKPCYSTTCVAISSEAGLVISGQEDGSVLVWDLIGGGLKTTLRGHSRGPDQLRLSNSGTRGVTFDSKRRDTSVWMWDFKTDKALGCYIFDHGVSCCEIAADGSSVIVGVPGSDSIVTLRPPGERKGSGDSLYGDPSRNGKVFDVIEST